jgi:hypothetical protein
MMFILAFPHVLGFSFSFSLATSNLVTEKEKTERIRKEGQR